MATDDRTNLPEAQETPLTLMEMQINALYKCDAYGRLQSRNQAGGGKAPRFFMGRTQAGNVLRLRDDLPRDLVKELETLAEREPLPYNFEEPAREQFQIMHALRRHNAVIEVRRGPAYSFPPQIDAPQGVRLLKPGEEGLLHPSLVSWAPDVTAGRDVFASFEDGLAVAVCFSACTGGQAAEAGVETAAPYRRRGHAARAVAAWALSIRAAGLVPIYSTTWDNAASQGVAKALGCRLFGEDWHIV